MPKLNIFISYSPDDEKFKKKLDTHLATLRRSDKVATWDSSSILAGAELDNVIHLLQSAHIIIILASANYIADDKLWDEQLKKAMERHKKSQARVIPIKITEFANSSSLPFSSIQGLPRNGKAVATATDMDSTLAEIAKEIGAVVDSLLAKGIGVEEKKETNMESNNNNGNDDNNAEKFMGIGPDTDNDYNYSYSIESIEMPKAQVYPKGFVLHNIPTKMQHLNEHLCLIRVAFDKTMLVENLPPDTHYGIKEVRISDTMEVCFIENEYFKVKPLNSLRQAVLPDEKTEWQFKVMPLKLGKFPLEFKVTVVLANGALKEVVLRESITVNIEPVPEAMLDLDLKIANLEPVTNKTMTHKQHLKSLIAEDKIGQAINELLEATAQNGQSDLNNSLVLLSGRHNRNEKEKHGGLIEQNGYNIERNRITNALQSYIEEYKDNGTYQFMPLTTNSIADPPQKTTVNTSPTTNNNTEVTGNGNIVIQGANDSNITINTGEKNKKPTDEALKEEPQTILFLAANPTSAASLQTDKEYRIIKAEWERGKHRDQYRFLLPQLSLTITELLRAMNDKPDIVHFSGHGTKDGIVLVKDDNTHQVMPTAALQRLFKNAKGHTKIVLLNACYSAEQAKVISALGITVIGNNLPIGDDAALSFAKGLYNGLSEGKDIENAYNDAIIVLLTENPDYANVVEVWQNGEKKDW